MLKFRKKRNRGSFLIEVLLTVIILSVSLTLIIQSIMSSMRGSIFSYGYSTAILLLENKLFKILNSSSDQIYAESGTFDKPNDLYHYSVDVKDALNQFGVENMDEIKVKVFWKSGKKQNFINVDTLNFRPIE